MKVKPLLLAFAALFVTPGVFAISLEHYQQLCNQPGHSSVQRKLICKKYKNRIDPNHSLTVSKEPSLKQPQNARVVYSNQAKTKHKQVVTSSTPSTQPKKTYRTTKTENLDSRQRRERLKFTPYTPGAFKAKKSEEKNEG